MDYIYVDSQGKKCVGEVEGIEISPNYQFKVKINGKNIWCLMDHTLSEWCIHLMELHKQVELSFPSDIVWNTEALYDVTHELESSIRIAYAIKSVYEKYNFEDVSF